MFAIPGLCALLVFIYVRPQEFVPALTRIPLLELLFALSLFGLVVDALIGRMRPRAVPQLAWVIVLWLWMVVTVAAAAPAHAQRAAIELAIHVTLFVIIAQGVQSFRGLEIVAATLLVLALLLSVVAIHQGTQPYGCAALDLSNPRDLSIGVPDGRPCETALDCIGRGAEPGAEYICERIGLFGTTSIGEGRVRYRGILQDPNELALALAAALPFAIAFAARKKTLLRRALAALAFVLVAICVVLTKSRGGQLVFVVVLGVYAARRLGKKGILVALAIALPILLFGGRSGGEADESAQLRMRAWREGLSMLLSHPILGVGQDQFTQYHELTAHNSYVLTAAELGLPGFVLWSGLLYASIKIPYQGLRRFARVSGAEVARDWALALLAAMSGLLLGILFLSMSYHAILFIFTGLCGAYYSAATLHDPDWRVRFGWRDLALLLAIDTAFLLGLAIYLATT